VRPADVPLCGLEADAAQELPEEEGGALRPPLENLLHPREPLLGPLERRSLEDLVYKQPERAVVKLEKDLLGRVSGLSWGRSRSGLSHDPQPLLHATANAHHVFQHANVGVPAPIDGEIGVLRIVGEMFLRTREPLL